MIPKRWWWVCPVVVQGSGPRMTTATRDASVSNGREKIHGDWLWSGCDREVPII